MKVILLSVFFVCAVQCMNIDADFVRPPHQLFPPEDSKVVEPRINLQELLEQIITQATNIALEAAKKIQAAINHIFDHIIDGITNIQNDSLEGLNEIFADMNELLIDWEHVGACFNNQANNLRNISLEARDSINRCQKNGSDAMQELHDSFADQRQAILNEFNRIYNVMENCLEDRNPIQVIMCVKNEVRNITSSIQEIVTQAQDIATNAVPKIIKIRGDTRKCIGAARKNAFNRTQVVIHNIRDCIVIGEPSTTEFNADDDNQL